MPKLVVSITGKKNRKPDLATPEASETKPEQVKFCGESETLRCKRSEADEDTPSRTEDLNGKADPKTATSRSVKEASDCAIPDRIVTNPEQPELLSSKRNLGCVTSETIRGTLKHARLLSDNENSGFVVSIANEKNRDPNLAMPETSGATP